MSTNPKLVGSNIIDCIPQTGECPLKCTECFYCRNCEFFYWKQCLKRIESEW